MNVFMIRKIIFIASVAFIFASCEQYPIFFTVSKEVEPKEADVTGSPSAFISNGASGAAEKLYIANGDIFYSTGSDWRWKKHSKPSGTVYYVAHTGISGTLYALTLSAKGQSIIWKYVEAGDRWENILDAEKLAWQAIYSANGRLFAVQYKGTPTKDGKDFNIVKIDTTNSSTLWSYGPTNFLNGVVNVSHNYYFATNGSGVLYASGESAPSANVSGIGGEDGNDIAAILVYTSNKVVATSYSGYIYKISGMAATKSVDHGKLTTALAYWNGGSTKLLLVGVRIDSVRFGYREMTIDASGDIDLASWEVPEKSSGDKDIYAATLETQALKALIQAPGTESNPYPLLFASTQKDGLWSFRKNSSNDDRYAWNREG